MLYGCEVLNPFSTGTHFHFHSGYNSEIHVGIKTVQTLAINLFTSIDLMSIEIV